MNEDHRCFMWCVLAHCLGVEGLNKTERKKTVSCSGSFFYPELVAASSCYVAVGRCGYVPPKELRLRLTHHERDSDKYHAVHCRECLASFETAENGQYLGALRHSCNIAAQTPKTIPVVFHNGGGYDFHFLLRYIATMGSPRRRSRRRSKRKRAREAHHAHGQGCAKAQGQGQGRAKTPHRLVRPAGRDQARRLHPPCLRVLCKSGEKCLQMSWGPLRFVRHAAPALHAALRQQHFWQPRKQPRLLPVWLPSPGADQSHAAPLLLGPEPSDSASVPAELPGKLPQLRTPEPPASAELRPAGPRRPRLSFAVRAKMSVALHVKKHGGSHSRSTG